VLLCALGLAELDRSERPLARVVGLKAKSPQESSYVEFEWQGQSGSGKRYGPGCALRGRQQEAATRSSSPCAFDAEERRCHVLQSPAPRLISASAGRTQSGGTGLRRAALPGNREKYRERRQNRAAGKPRIFKGFPTGLPTWLSREPNRGEQGGLKWLQGAPAKKTPVSRKRGTAFQIDHCTIIIMQRSSDRIGPSHFYSWRHTRNDPCGVRAFQRRRGKRRPRRICTIGLCVALDTVSKFDWPSRGPRHRDRSGRSFRRIPTSGAALLSGSSLGSLRWGTCTAYPARHRIPRKSEAIAATFLLLTRSVLSTRARPDTRLLWRAKSKRHHPVKNRYCLWLFWMSSWNRLSLQAIPLVVIVSAVSCGAPNSTILHEAAAYIHVTAGLWVEHARLPKARYAPAARPRRIHQPWGKDGREAYFSFWFQKFSWRPYPYFGHSSVADSYMTFGHCGSSA